MWIAARGFAALLLACTLTVSYVSPARAAGPPIVLDSWVTEVTATSAKLHARLNPNGLSGTYRIEYLTEAAYRANLDADPPRDGFFGAAFAPPSGSAPLGSGTAPGEFIQQLSSLAPQTAYRYRVLASNQAGSTLGAERRFATQAATNVSALPDRRAWELITPPDKGTAALALPESLFSGGVFQAAASGSALTYSSAGSFAGPAVAPPVSQYLSARSAAGWATRNVSAPMAAGAYGDQPDGAPYRLFSEELTRALLFGGLSCRIALTPCPLPNPVLPGAGAPPGYMAYYLGDPQAGQFTSLLSADDLAHSSGSPEAFDLRIAAASPDLDHLILSTCAALTADATETLLEPGRCDPAAQNLYRWSTEGTLVLLNVLPGEQTGTPGAEIAAPIGALSEAGARVYWRATATGGLYLSDSGESFPVEESGTAAFQAASADGSAAFFTLAGHLFRYDAGAHSATDLTPAGGVLGVLAVSGDGSRVYFQDGEGLKLWHAGETTLIAPGADASSPANHPPATGAAHLSPDGLHLAFLSERELTGYDNDGHAQLFLFGPPPGAGVPQLICASCNPTGERARGPVSVSALRRNGTTAAYRPRALSADGRRLYFTSPDPLVLTDTNSAPDLYQWEADGTGTCAEPPGCLGLLSGGRDGRGATFIDASADGSDVYFLTDSSLLPADPGFLDLYDVRVGGGLPEAERPIACRADACQALPSPPDDPQPATLVPTAGNPPPRYHKPRRRHRRRHHNWKGGRKGKHPSQTRSAQTRSPWAR